METQTNTKPIRCAIYTRKSTTDGAEQDFTSLDAQRESALSYIQSQKSLGWVALSQEYDDYGFTGANMNRPALERLIDDINAGKIDCIVVYKVDRLSRSLLDFTKLLELFDGKGVTFVSVTQHFNTNNSMGRLTLNILLSFAQFEREIISERTRDKIGAAKKKGKFVGGRPPLGYDLDKENHKLVVSPKEAELVRFLFNTYLQQRSLLRVAIMANEKGYRTKKCLKNGLFAGEKEFSRTNLQLMLRNITYTGQVRYHNEILPGQQEPIISKELFNSVQKILTGNRDLRPVKAERESHIGILSQIFHCSTCKTSMIRSYTVKRKKFKYTFYVCSNAIKRGYKNCPVKTVNAQRTENTVVNYLRGLSENPYLKPGVWDKLAFADKRKIIKAIIKSVDYDGKSKKLTITLLPDNVRHEFPIDLKINPQQKQTTKEEMITQEPPIRRQLLLAHHMKQLLDNGKAKDLQEIATWLNISQPRAHQIFSLLFLCPSIQETILLSDNPTLLFVPEYKVIEMGQEFLWKKQLIVWKNLFIDAVKE